MTTNSVSHAELVLLALMGDRASHGYQLLQQIRSMRIERWARIAESTLYAVLRRMEKRGWVRGEIQPGARHKAKTTYHRTSEGKSRLKKLIAHGLGAPSPTYSDRIVAAVFASAIGQERGLDEAIAALVTETDALLAAAEQPELSEPGEIILRYQAEIAGAQLNALNALRILASASHSHPLPVLSNGRSED